MSNMTVGEALAEYRIETGLSQQDIADQLHIDQAIISKVESGKRTLNESHDANVSRLNWRLALKVADERTGGYINNIMEDIPGLDLHPAALKEVLLKDLKEAISSLEELMLAKHIPIEKRQESAKKVWHDIRDVIERSLVIEGVIEEEFELDKKRLIQEHDLQLKQGER